MTQSPSCSMQLTVVVCVHCSASAVTIAVSMPGCKIVVCALIHSYIYGLKCNNIPLYYTILYCTVLYCTVLYCTVLYCTVLYCTVLYL